MVASSIAQIGTSFTARSIASEHHHVRPAPPCGFAISVCLCGVGALDVAMESLDEFLGPLFLGLQTLPSVCWVPLAILTFGLNERAILFVLVMGSFFAIAISLRDGLRTIPPVYAGPG